MRIVDPDTLYKCSRRFHLKHVSKDYLVKLLHIEVRYYEYNMRSAYPGRVKGGFN